MWIVDQIDEGVATLEHVKSKEIEHICLKKLPKEASVGSALKKEAGMWKICTNETKLREDRILRLFNEVRVRSKS